MRPEIQDVIGRVPAWADAQALRIEPLAGLTNTNYLVTAGGERYVLRIAGANGERLGIDRELELENLLAAANAGLGPEVVYSLLPEGHLVTGYIDGRHWTLDEYRTEVNLKRVVEALKRLHALPPVRAAFSPFRRVEAFADRARAMGVPFPADFDALVQTAGNIERAQHEDASPWRRFCHNDLFCVNVLDDGRVRFVDWEFSGMGDIYFDLATLLYAYDSLETLSPELEAYLLKHYFGEVTAGHWVRLGGMRYMLLFFTAMWGLLQQGLLRQGLVRRVEGFDYFEYAGATFEAMRACAEWR